MKKILEALAENSYYQKYKFLILPVFSLIFFIVVIVTIVIPQFKSIFESQKKIAEVTEREQFFKSKLAVLKDIPAKDYRDDINITLVALPDEKDVPGAIGQLLFLLGSNGLKLEAIGVADDPATVKGAAAIRLRAELIGSKTGLASFIEDLTDSARLFKLTAIEVTILGGENILSSINVSTYYEALPSTIGSIDQPVSNLTDADTKLLAKIKSVSRGLETPTSTRSATKGKTNPFE